MRKVQLNPVGWMSQLSQVEVARLQDAANGQLFQMFKNCCLAVLNSGVDEDNFEVLFAPYENFDVRLIRRERGVKIELVNPPEVAFVDDKLVRGVHEHLFAVLRDLLFMGNKYAFMHQETPVESSEVTDMVFDMLRHANALEGNDAVNTIVCWGGHSIKPAEYKYTKDVGYHLGLREMNICTGCGPGAMKGPMKGATIGHAKQRYKEGRYIGISEPSIIAAEPPNAIVNELLIMPDIEKRLEGFVRLAHGIVIFPGGVGTAEELLYLLGILLNDRNAQQPFPVILTGPAGSEAYFDAIDQFIGATLGNEARSKYQIIIDNPEEVARSLVTNLERVRKFREAMGDAFSFNWSLRIDEAFQHPFIPTHETMSALKLDLSQDKASLAVVLRQAFSGIVAGNVKAEGITQIKENGPFELTGDKTLMTRIDALLKSFVAQGRMKLPGTAYEPCYVVNKS
jgi:predicted Rossmann-fold nucleotide-binding protein